MLFNTFLNGVISRLMDNENNDCLISFRRFIFINSGGEICPWLVASVECSV